MHSYYKYHIPNAREESKISLDYPVAIALSRLQQEANNLFPIICLTFSASIVPGDVFLSGNKRCTVVVESAIALFRAWVLARNLRPLQGPAREVKHRNLHEMESFVMDNKGYHEEEWERRAKIKRMFSWSDGLPGWVSDYSCKIEGIPHLYIAIILLFKTVESFK